MDIVKGIGKEFKKGVRGIKHGISRGSDDEHKEDLRGNLQVEFVLGGECVVYTGQSLHFEVVATDGCLPYDEHDDSFVAIVPADEDSEELDLSEKHHGRFSALRRFVRFKKTKLHDDDGMGTLVRSPPARAERGSTSLVSEIDVPLLAESPNDCPDLLYRDDQQGKGASEMENMLSSVRSDLARYEKTRGVLSQQEVIALRRFRIEQYEDAKKTYHLAEATEMAGKLLGQGAGVVVTLGFIYVGGAMSTIKRLAQDTSQRAVQNWAMQNPELAVSTAYKTARFIPGKTGKVIAIGTCAAVAAKSGLDIVAATDAAYHGVVKGGAAMDDNETLQQEAAATACTTAVIIASGDKKKAARAFIPRIKRMCGVQDDDTSSDKTFMAAATKGFKKAAAAETRQLLRNVRVGEKFGSGLADQLNKKIGLTRIREKSERLADEQLYELRFMKQHHEHKKLFHVVGRSAPFHVRRSEDRPNDGDSGVIKVGSWDGPGPKHIRLPKKGLYVDATPRNPVEAHWADEFECLVEGEELTVRRIDAPNEDQGWSQDLELLYLTVSTDDLAMLDTDGDGVLSLEEFMQADADGDGILSADEVRDAAADMRVATQGTLHVGSWDGPGPKVVKLHREGLKIDPTPLNLPQGVSDRFKCTVFGAELHVIRVDDGHVNQGWGHSYDFQWFDRSNFHGVVKIGPFEGPGGTASIALPCPGLYVDSTPVNRQEQGWTDTFETRVIGNRVEVWRVDQTGAGWSQPLELRYYLITAEARAALDKDGDGVISHAEFSSLDTDGDGKVSEREVARSNKGAVARAHKDEDAAATTIQAHFRGFITRKKLPW